MNAMIEPCRLRRHFSKAATRYTQAADIQAAVASELEGKLCLSAGARVLDVGAGNGMLASALRRNGADVLALDAAWGMGCEGRRALPDVTWVQADAGAMPFRPESFDLVVSSSAYQWVDDLPRAFREVKRVLRPGGKFCAVLFARGTLDEFFVSMERAAASSRRVLPRLRRLPSADDVRFALDEAGFKDPLVAVEQRVSLFPDVRAVLAWLKNIGANASARDFFWGKGLLAATEREYRSGFPEKDKLRVTFEVAWIEVRA